MQFDFNPLYTIQRFESTKFYNPFNNSFNQLLTLAQSFYNKQIQNQPLLTIQRNTEIVFSYHHFITLSLQDHAVNLIISRIEQH